MKKLHKNFHAPEPQVKRLTHAEFMAEMKKGLQDVICYPTHRLPSHIRNRKVNVVQCERDYLNGYRVPVMSLSEIEAKL